MSLFIKVKKGDRVSLGDERAGIVNSVWQTSFAISGTNYDSIKGTIIHVFIEEDYPSYKFYYSFRGPSGEENRLHIL